MDQLVPASLRPSMTRIQSTTNSQYKVLILIIKKNINFVGLSSSFKIITIYSIVFGVELRYFLVKHQLLEILHSLQIMNKTQLEKIL